MLTNLVTFAIINPPEKNTVMHGASSSNHYNSPISLKQKCFQSI